MEEGSPAEKCGEEGEQDEECSCCVEDEAAAAETGVLSDGTLGCSGIALAGVGGLNIIIIIILIII